MRILALSICFALAASPAAAQLGRLSGALDKAEKVKKLADIKISAEEERQIGQQVSDRIVQDFGVLQDKAVTRYVTLAGTVLAQASSRPDLPWQFVVLDTDGVNAFAAPGGFVHVTRGLLGLIKNEAELAGVLAHEIVHITDKHTVNAIQKSDAINFASDEVSASGGMTQALVAKFADAAYRSILDNAFSRGDENSSDVKGAELASKAGYAPSGLAAVLEKLAARNATASEPSGMFASHPVIKDRIANLTRAIQSRKLQSTATVAARYSTHVTWDVKPVGEIALVPAGSRGLAGGGDDKAADKKTEEKKPSGGRFGAGLSRLTGGGTQSKQSQTVASAGARGVNPDRDAAGGPNKTRITIRVTPAEVAEFKKGIA
jgi:beta-barrel assembly-enhancing protease